jgi:hydrogenase-4 component B
VLPEGLPDGPAPWYGFGLAAWLVVAAVGAVWRRQASPVLPALMGLGSLLVLLGALAGGDATITLAAPWFLGDAAVSVVVDPLSRWFLGVIGAIGLPVALFSPGYLEHLRQRVPLGLVWSALVVLFASMALVVLAANAIAFLVAWEAMALSSYGLVVADHEKRVARRAALTYLGATRAGTAMLMGGFLWAHQLTGSWCFAEWHLTGSAALGPALLVLAGLATKAGCWPFHLWLPIAHPAAPAPVSAVMSGVMIKTAIYAMARLLLVGSHLDAPVLGPLLLVLGAISALWGVLFALLQHDLKRLLAYHSVENIGIILMGLGISLIGVRQHNTLLAQLGLAAALFHVLNHAVFKGLLFLGAGAVDARTHLRDVEKLGGLVHRMPWTAGAFVVGSAAICALPPLNGFASEWLLYRGFFGLASAGPSAGVRLAALVLMGWLALVGALAVACFVKAVGVVFLGAPRSTQAEHAREAGRGMVVAQIALAGLCVGLGVAVPQILGALGRVAEMLGEPSVLQTAWTVPTALLALVLVATLGGLAMWMAALAHNRPAREYVTWDCGFGSLGPRTQYTATSFAQPISRLFGSVYRYAVAVSMGGRHRRHFPEEVVAEVSYEAYLETRLYAPAIRGLRRASGALLMALQAGSIHQYLVYMALVLALLLWVGCR